MFPLLAWSLILYFVVCVFVMQGPPENQLIAEAATLLKAIYLSIVSFPDCSGAEALGGEGSGNETKSQTVQLQC